MFFIESQFDYIEISYTTGLPWTYYTGCVRAMNCSSLQIKIMQDVRMELLGVLPKQSNTSSTGLLVLSKLAHTHLLQPTWHNPANTKEAIAKQFADWYFHGKTAQFIPDCPHPYGCS